ncbi:MAG: hypothetical protein AAFY30_13935, partial [Cyanobacteria bacterium J06642_12]
DNLIGNGGSDILVGGSGRDTLAGGGGSDMFRYESLGELERTNASADIIQNFDVNGDMLDVRELFGAGATFNNSITLAQLGRDTLVLASAPGQDFRVARLIGVDADTVDSSNFMI